MPTKKFPPLSIRRAGAKFRLRADRDDHNPGFDTVKIFVPSPLMHGGDIGIAAGAVVVLQGYAVAQVGDKNLTSVQLTPNSHVIGRMVDLHPEELARLDQVSEHAGAWHRFLAEVVGPVTGSRFSVWVYQALTHATAVEQAVSAAELPKPRTGQLQIANAA